MRTITGLERTTVLNSKAIKPLLGKGYTPDNMKIKANTETTRLSEKRTRSKRLKGES